MMRSRASATGSQRRKGGRAHRRSHGAGRRTKAPARADRHDGPGPEKHGEAGASKSESKHSRSTWPSLSSRLRFFPSPSSSPQNAGIGETARGKKVSRKNKFGLIHTSQNPRATISFSVTADALCAPVPESVRHLRDWNVTRGTHTHRYGAERGSRSGLSGL
jgi:hypothetical protein